MEESMSLVRYWCHMCSQVVNPIMETEFKCSICQSGFIQEITSTNATLGGFNELDLVSDRALSLWAPILFGIMGSHHRRRRYVLDGNHDESNRYGDNINRGRLREIESELDRELNSTIRRQRRSSNTIFQLLQGIRAKMVNYEESRSINTRNGEMERSYFINPFHQTIIMQDSPNLNNGQNQNTFVSFGDYFIGQSLDLLLQHLSNNYPNRYGTPPTQREVVEALPIVKIEGCLQCSVCLDDFDIGAEAKEMPCKHKFHSQCLLPWLELHSSCPICRYQLPIDELKRDLEDSTNRRTINDGQSIHNGSVSGENEDRSESSDRGLSLRWPFSTLLSSLEPLTTGGDSSLVASTSSSSSTGAPQASSQTDGS